MFCLAVVSQIMLHPPIHIPFNHAQGPHTDPCKWYELTGVSLLISLTTFIQHEGQVTGWSSKFEPYKITSGPKSK